MKRVRINAGKVGLVFRNGDYKRVITQGNHWLRLRDQVSTYDLAKPFYAPVHLDLLLKDERLSELLTVVEVKDNELVLHYENKLFKSVLGPGRYAFLNGLVEHKFVTADLSKIEITEKIDKNLFSNHNLSRYIRSYEINAHEKGMLLVDDAYMKMLDSGVYRYWLNDTNIKVLKADLRTQQVDIAGQELLTKDKAAIRINFNTQYKVTDVEKALLDNKDSEKQLYSLLQLALRKYVGAYTLDELLERKEDMASSILSDVKNTAAKLGIKVLDCGIRDVILPGDMKAIMNQVLVAQKQAQANIIMRREETASTRSLLNTAKLMEENSMLFKLKEMEYVEKIADKIGEITLSNNGGMIKQLKDIFSVNR
ncbi:MAG: slipin family protein [Flavobacteriaceae bacterium]|nr:slipin family protein [Flavobacteriaceae bacterium]